MPSALAAALLLLAEVSSSIVEAHLAVPSPCKSSNDCSQPVSTAPAPARSSSGSLERLLISFLPAVTENKGRSKHAVGAFQCALEVSPWSPVPCQRPRVVIKVKVAHTRLPSVGFRSRSRFLAVSLQVT